MVATSVERAPSTGEAATERFSAATVHEAAGRTGALPARIRPVYSTAEIYGPAFPVLCPVGDNLWLHRAVAEASPGDILVVQTTAADDYGYWGEILSEAARARGLGGLVLDGGVRDVGALEIVGMPVFSSTVCLNGTVKDPEGPGCLGAPIRLGEIRIERGDVVVGDIDGVVVVPQDRWPTVATASREREAREASIIAKIRSGASTLDLYSLPR